MITSKKNIRIVPIINRIFMTYSLSIMFLREKKFSIPKPKKIYRGVTEDIGIKL